jgi:hypothetical protein
MSRAISNLRPVARATAALLLLAAFLHCAWEWQAEVAHATASVELRAPAPQMPLPGCNESGCICRGATIVQAIDGGMLAEASAWVPLDLPAANCSLAGLPNASQTLAAEDPAAPLSGRQLRALYASLVI